MLVVDCYKQCMYSFEWFGRFHANSTNVNNFMKYWPREVQQFVRIRHHQWTFGAQFSQIGKIFAIVASVFINIKTMKECCIKTLT